MNICAIHQPNFFPWIGYFDKIRQADVFIFLDEVAYPKSGSGSGSWCNRVKIQLAGQEHWFGLPIKHESGKQLIHNVEFFNQEYYVSKLLKTLKQAYRKAKYFSQIMPLIQNLLEFSCQNLAEYNIHAITKLSAYLGFKTKFIRQSKLQHSAQSTQLLVQLVKCVGANAYLCGNGASDYQQDECFSEKGIRLIYQDINPAQFFFPYLDDVHRKFSILHLLFHFMEEMFVKNQSSHSIETL
ncbi:MAG: WbqC family protein [Gammaproteobacteria bacterium]|jgi:hypothetical protein|nr:WbqC family protein [Gammaproteobacteria bacterium]